MWIAVISGMLIYLIVKLFFYEDDALLDLSSSHFSALFTVAKRLEKLYLGSKVYIGLQIPDADSASRQNIDLILVTRDGAMVISVKNISGFVSTDKEGNWVCTVLHKTDVITNPVPETKRLVSVLEGYLEQRGVALPEGYLSVKVICPNPKFVFFACVLMETKVPRTIDSDSFPPEVITYDQWKQLKPGHKSLYSGWIKGVLGVGKDKTQDSFFEQLNSVLSTAPISDRLELKGNKYVLGEFIEFKGKEEDLKVLRKIKRSKISQLSIQKISMFGLAHSTVQVLYTPRDYRVEGSTKTSHWEEVTVRSSTEVFFQPLNSTKPHKYKLSSVIALSLSA